ncbi:g2473 [Coccomyxa viridis]|uniref:G2473 protein n=1 Tax=Coccomyxa viridis TaxID=1274662 RepID=A0ABP1FMR1_9CHLO
MNRKLGDVGDDSARIPSSAFFVEHAAPAEAAGGIATGGHRAQSTMTAGDLLKAEHVTLDVGTHKQLMEDVPIEKRLLLSFPHISAWVPDLLGPGSAEGGNIFSKTFHKLKGGKPKAGKPKERQILYDISGTCRPGEVLALMGPSGSGKTTLLSILGGRGPASMTMTGHPTFNQEKLTKRAKRSVGFVLQDDLLYETLTVYETLYYAAMLRLPSTMSAEQKVERVDHVIHTLGLNKCRDTIVGGFFQRGISGGERKRVSVGHELLINPSIILLDEPTSGLDSTTAMNLVTSLCQLAAGGRAVVTTIHQPSSRLYQQLDKLLLLSEGHAMYYGRANLAAHWFHTLGFTCPYGVNVADFILDVSSGAVNSSKLESEDAVKHLTACSERYAEAFPKEDGYRHPETLNEDILGTSLWTAARSRKNIGTEGSQHMDSIGLDEQDYRRTSSSEASSSSQAYSPDEMEKGTKSKRPTESRWGASYSLQLRILFIRAIKTRRFDSMSSQDLFQFIVVGVLTGLFWWQQGKGDTLYSAQNSNGLLFFEMLFLAFRAMFVALFTFPSEYKMMLKERASGMYRLSAFYFARSASDLPFEATPSLFVFIIYFMGGLRLTPGAFFANWFATMLVTLVAQSFGLLIGATVMNAKTAQTVTAVVMLTMMLVGGFYVTSIPVWIAWLKYLSFVYYGYDLLLKVEYQGRTLWDCSGIPNPPNPSSNPACTIIPPGGLQAKLHLQENTENWPWEAVVLIGWLIFFRYLVYVALRYKTAAPEAKGH